MNRSAGRRPDASPWFRLADACARRPRRVLAVALVLVAASLALAATRLELRTSNLDLVDPDLPEVARFRRAAERWGTPNTLSVVLESATFDPTATEPADAASRRALAVAAERLAPRLAALPSVREVVHRLPIPDAAVAWAGIDPYLGSRDGGLAVLFVQPIDPESRADQLAPFVEAVRAVLDDADLGALGVRAGLTGIPAYALDDRDTIQRDVGRLSIVGFALVGLLVLFAFGDRRQPLLALGALVVAVIVGVGVGSVWPGHLTLLSAFFASILFGLGVDFAIHVLDRLDELGDHDRAIATAIGSLGPALATAAATSSAIFLAMLFGGFRGFAELGFLAGVGVLLCLLATVTVLPALLTSAPPATRRERRRLGELVARLHRHPAGVVGAWILGGATLLTALAPAPGFDADYLNLQPVGSETVRLERALVERSDLSPSFALFEADSIDRRDALVAALSAEPSVGAVDARPADGSDPDGSTAWAIRAHPAGDLWQSAIGEEFLDRMRALDPEVTGMPMLGDFMIQRTWRAVRTTAGLGAILLLVCVGVGLRRPLPTLVAVLPAFGTVAALHGVMRWLGLSYNPLDIMALPVVLGIAVDDGVHVVHRFLAEDGRLDRALAGTGRAVFLTSATTLAAFGPLVFAEHRGLASFAQVLCLGVGLALLLSLWVLPELLGRLRPWLIPADVPEPAPVDARPHKLGA